MQVVYLRSILVPNMPYITETYKLGACNKRDGKTCVLIFPLHFHQIRHETKAASRFTEVSSRIRCRHMLDAGRHDRRSRLCLHSRQPR